MRDNMHGDIPQVADVFSRPAPPMILTLPPQDTEVPADASPFALLRTGTPALRKIVPKPLFEIFDDKAYLIRPPMQLMRLVDSLRYHKPTLDERAELNLCSSTERIYLHALTDLLLVCGGRKGFRFTSNDINRLRQNCDDITKRYDSLDATFTSLPLEVTQYKFPANVQRIEDEPALYNELSQAGVGCEKQRSPVEAIRWRAFHFQKLARDYVNSYSRLRATVKEIRVRFKEYLVSHDATKHVEIIQEPVEAEFEAKSHRPFPVFLYHLIQKYHREQRKSSTEWTPSCPEPPVESIGVFSVFLAYALLQGVALTQDEVHSFQVLLQVLKLRYQVDAKQMRIFDIRHPSHSTHSKRSTTQSHGSLVTNTTLCNLLYEFLSTIQHFLFNIERGEQMTSVFSDDGSLDAALTAEAMDRERDDDGVVEGERMMSMDELKQEMFKSLKDTGTIEAIRAQLRRRFIEKLKQHGRKVARGSDNNGEADNNDEQTPTWGVDEQLIHGLIHEYLERRGMEHTLAVFVPEVGGLQQLLSRDAITKMLRLSEGSLMMGAETNNQTTQPLVQVLMKELMRRLTVSTMSSGSQTAMDCHDHRIALENQLRRVETTYLAEVTTRKSDHSVKSFEERVLRYQREYDESCEKRIKEDMERFKAVELGLMRVEERKKFEREMDALKTSMFQEHRDRLQRLQDRERELEMDFAAKKAELEAALFEARQRVFQDIEKLRVKQQESEAKYNSESRQLAMEAKRLQLFGDSLKIREENIQSAVDGIVQEKEKALHLERLQWQSGVKAREQELLAREQDLQEGVDALAKERDTVKELRKTITILESEVLSAKNALLVSEKKLEKLDVERKALRCELDAREQLLGEDKHNMKNLSYEQARLTAELKASQAERSKLENSVMERSSQVKQLESEVKEIQHQLITLKLNEANAVVEERKKFANLLEAEREDARWKENELVGRLRDLQSRLAESEATADKFQTQFEDEKVHVETLRHEVSSLHALLAQSQSAVSTRQHGSGRSSSTRTREGDAHDSTERMLMKMMEMMSHMATFEAIGAQRTASGTVAIHDSQGPGQPKPPMISMSDEEEAAKLRQEQDRRERELLEQREFERKKVERDEAERLEMEQRRKEFQDQLEQERQERQKHDEEAQTERRRQIAEEEAQLQDALEKQRKALEEARETHKRHIDEQVAAEQARLQQERARDEERARIEKEEADLAAERLRRMREQQAEEERKRELAMEKQQQADHVVWVTTIDGSELSHRQNTIEIRPSELKNTTEIFGSHVDNTSVVEIAASTSETKQEVNDVSDIQDSNVLSESESFRSDQQDENGDSLLERPTPDEKHDGKELHVGSLPPPSANDRPEEHDENVHAESADNVAELVLSEIPVSVASAVEKSEEELEEERRRAAEEAKKKEDEDALDIYRQRVLARRAAEKQRQQELEEQRKREDEERAAAELARQQEDELEDELERSGGSFASSAASSSGSF